MLFHLPSRLPKLQFHSGNFLWRTIEKALDLLHSRKLQQSNSAFFGFKFPMHSETVALPKTFPSLHWNLKHGTAPSSITGSTKRLLPSTASNQWIPIGCFKGQKLRLEEHLPDRSWNRHDEHDISFLNLPNTTTTLQDKYPIQEQVSIYTCNDSLVTNPSQNLGPTQSSMITLQNTAA